MDGLHKTGGCSDKNTRKRVGQMHGNVTGAGKHRRIFWPAAAAAAVTLLAAALLAVGWRVLRGRGADGPLLPHSGRPAQRHVVAVDSGHGGTDVGAKGLVDEITVTQTTAAALLALLEADGAYAPVRVHTDDTAPSPQQRAQTARETGAELFLSLHANKDTSTASCGFECYAVPPGQEQHEESLAFARLICARMQEAGARIRGVDGVRYAYYRGGSKTMKESSDDTVYRDPTFGVLQDAACPSVLIEQCFISNAEDLAAWGDAEGCAAAAYCYYLAICDYFGTQPLPMG